MAIHTEILPPVESPHAAISTCTILGISLIATNF